MVEMGRQDRRMKKRKRKHRERIRVRACWDSGDPFWYHVFCDGSMIGLRTMIIGYAQAPYGSKRGELRFPLFLLD
jgi:hypothetical protein